MHLTASRARRSLVAIAASVVVIGLAGPAWAAPSNDSFTNPTTVREPLAKHHGVSVAGTNVGASTQPGEPSRSCAGPPEATVWYRWSPRRTHDAFAQATSRESNAIDPVLAVYRVSPSGLHEIGCNDDVRPGTLTAKVNFEAVRGISYLISVDGFGKKVTSPAEGPVPMDPLGEGSFTLYVR